MIHSNDSDFEAKVKKLLFGKSVISVEQISDRYGKLELDDGTVLFVEGNEGCGGCGNGWFYLKQLEECYNAITNVECEHIEEFDEDGYCDIELFRIFVFAENKKIKLVEYDGYDNGYYGTGYSLYVSLNDKNDETNS